MRLIHLVRLTLFIAFLLQRYIIESTFKLLLNKLLTLLHSISSSFICADISDILRIYLLFFKVCNSYYLHFNYSASYLNYNPANYYVLIFSYS